MKRFHDDDQLRHQLTGFIAVHDFGRRLGTLKGLTSCEFVCKGRATEPGRFSLDPLHPMPGLDVYPPF